MEVVDITLKFKIWQAINIIFKPKYITIKLNSHTLSSLKRFLEVDFRKYYNIVTYLWYPCH